ncbi:Expansin-related protein [Salix suchowensis]|nr:Expansin-related protein [Salix suchowensis]
MINLILQSSILQLLHPVCLLGRPGINSRFQHSPPLSTKSSLRHEITRSLCVFPPLDPLALEEEEQMGFNIGSVFLMVAIVSCLISVAHAAQGNAVYYDPPYTRSSAGVSDALWNGGAACGRRYRVSCVRGANKAPKPCRQGSVVVTVVDYCSRGCNGIINLSKDAFSRIADPNAGNVVIQYNQV